jgi:lysozyme
MKINQDGISLIKNFESLHDGDLKQVGLQPKMCPAQIWTVGWGHAIVDPVTRKFLRGSVDKDRAYSLYPAMTEREAELLLQRDLDAFSASVRKLVKSKINDNQFSALVSFAYNLGAGNLQKSTLLKKVNVNPSDVTIAGEFAKWNKSGGVVLNGLTRRRKAESDLYFKK